MIRRASSAEAEALHALAIRSKAFWGYDASFMAVASQHLALPKGWINSGRVWLAEVDNEIAGVAAVLPPDRAGTAELEQLFIDPLRMGEGIGTALLAHVAALARSEGATCLQVLSDPHARAFYERFGFRWIKDAPSDAIPGRTLPVLALCL
jgi:GNAT superfamily N-acetyltransferase